MLSSSIMFYFRVVIFLTVLSFIHPIICSKINVRRILLPVFKTTSVSFTFHVSGGGCFKWSTSNDIISVEALNIDPYFECSSKAVVTTKSNNFLRSTAIVLAKDVENGNEIRADVIVDVIFSLKIVARTRRLHIEEPPELFEVRAYDSKGNEFSSLEGIEFKWDLNESSVEKVLQFISFKDSSYGSPLSVQRLESIKKQGHIVLLEGVKTGSAKLSVHLPHTEYNFVHSAEVQLMVAANLIIEPSDALVILHDTIEYHLLQVHGGQKTKLDLIGSQYSLQSEDTSVAVVRQCQNSELCVTGVRPGKVKLILYDTNVAHEETEKLPFTYITIKLPAFLSLSISPYDQWDFLVHQPVSIVSQVFDSNNHQFHLGSNTHITVAVPQDLFEVTSEFSNGTVVGSGFKTGVGFVVSTMKYRDINLMVESIEVSRTLHILEPLSLPPVLVLPYERKEYLMIADGGDKKNKWSSSKISVASINHLGLLKFNKPGVTVVTVSLIKCQYVNASSTVHVLLPDSIRVLSYLNEGPVGFPIYIPIAMYSTTLINGSLVKVPLIECEPHKFNVQSKDNFSFNYSFRNKTFSSACINLVFISELEGEFRVIVNYHSEKNLLKTELVIVTYAKLMSVHPTLEKTVLAIGSSLQLAFVGGPRSRFSKTSPTYSFQQNILTSSTVVDRKGVFVFEVKCVKVGETAFSLFLIFDLFMFDAIMEHSSAQITVICSEPFYVSLIGKMKPSCPEVESEMVLATMGEKLLLDVVIMDKNKQVFDNATSLIFRWSMNTEGLLEFNDQGSVNLETKETPNFKIPVKHFKIVTTKRISGFVTVNLQVIGGKPSSFSEFSSSVIGSLLIKVVNVLVVDPKSVAILLHPSNTGYLRLSRGSGYFEYQMNPKNFVDVRVKKSNYLKGDQVLELIPKYDGKGNLYIVDMCAKYPMVSVPLRVIQVGEIKITGVEKIEKGQLAIAVVQILDNENQPITLPDLINDQSEQLIHCASSDIVEVTKRRSTVADRLNGIVKYLIRGLIPGNTTVQAKWLGVKSLPVSIQVFLPVRIFPRDLTLVTGAEVHVSVHDGPLPYSGLQYQIGNTYIASVTSSFVKGLHVGRTTLTVVARSHDSEVYSKDSIEVNVISPKGIRIHAPIRQLCVGCTMPLWAVETSQNLSPLILGSVNPPYQFHWSVSSHNIAQLKDTLQDTGIEILNENRISMHILGLNPGKVTVFLSVYGQSVKRSFTFNSSLQLEIVRKLAVNNHEGYYKTMLVAPNTDFKLKTNKDEDCSLHYQIFNFDKQLKNKNQNLDVITINSTGHLSSGSVYTSALVTALCDDDFHQKEVSGVIVEVRPVSYMMVNILSHLETDGRKIYSFPNGICLLANVTYHDSIGSVFDAVTAYIKYEHTQADHVQISQVNASGNIFTLSLKNTGSTVIYIYDESLHQLGDYIKFSITNELYPSRVDLSLGEIVCFNMPVVNCDVLWNSDNSSLVISNYGIAYATKIGSSLISLSCENPTSFILISTRIAVLPVNSVQFENIGNLAITNSNLETKYLVVFTLRNEKNQNNSLSTFINECPEMVIPGQFPFYCKIYFTNDASSSAIESVFSVRPSFNVTLGLYACEISSLAGDLSNTSLIQSNITLTVSVKDSIFDSVTLKFYPAVFVSNRVLHFTSLFAAVTLTVTGIEEVLDQVYLETSHEVLSFTEPDRSEAFCVKYRVILRQEYWYEPELYIDLSLIVVSNLTNEKLKVEISTSHNRYKNALIPYIILKSDTWWQYYAELYNTYNSPIITFVVMLFVYFAFNFLYLYFGVLYRNTREQMLRRRATEVITLLVDDEQSCRNESTQSSDDSALLNSDDEQSLVQCRVFKRSIPRTFSLYEY